MTNPLHARSTFEGRFYTWPTTGEEFISVTTVLGEAMRKQALERWGPKMAAEWVVENMDYLGQTLAMKNGKSLAIDAIKSSPYRESDAAKDIGTLIHEIAEAKVNGLPVPEYQEKHAGFVQQFENWLEEWRPNITRTECTVYNRRYGYAGTADLIFEVKPGGKRVRYLGDYKTTKPGKQGHGIYPEAALQMAAYRHGEFIGLPNGTEEPMVEVDDCVGINLRPNYYAVVPVESDEKVFRTFLYCMQVARFQKQGANLIGKPLAPPIQAVAS